MYSYHNNRKSPGFQQAGNLAQDVIQAGKSTPTPIPKNVILLCLVSSLMLL